LMACMGGRIDLDGSARQGNRFVLTLASAGSDGRLPLATSAAEPAARRTPGKVLYIEDNPVNVILVEELIAQRGDLSLCCEVTGAQGVARAQELHPDLVLIDMQLPDFDGFEVLRQLRAHPATAHSRCIALSANAMPDDVALALAAGFDDYWTKPIRFNRFLEGLDGIFPRPAAG
jgi:CheY-like chemotaxis protein